MGNQKNRLFWVIWRNVLIKKTFILRKKNFRQYFFFLKKQFLFDQKLSLKKIKMYFQKKLKNYLCAENEFVLLKIKYPLYSPLLKTDTLFFCLDMKVGSRNPPHTHQCCSKLHHLELHLELHPKFKNSFSRNPLSW